ncbi:MAG: Clp protease N-terminal domain-containing protein [Actinomycetota bacterium]
MREALQLDHKYIGSEHLLLALIKEGESVGSQILKDKKVGLDDLRQTVIQLIAPKTAD